MAETTFQFSRTLDTLDIPHQMKLTPGAGHTNYLDNPAFQRELYKTCFRLASSSKGDGIKFQNSR